MKLESEDCVVTDELATYTGVSGRTVREDLKKLQIQGNDNGFLIESRPHYGHKLIITDRELYSSFKKSLETDDMPVISKSRAPYLIIELLENDGKYTTIESLAMRYFVSVTTMTTILKQAEEILFGFQCSIERKTNRGIRITGREIDKRLCIYHCLLHFHLTKYYRNRANLSQIQNMFEKFNQILDDNHIYLNEISYYHFMALLHIDIHRNQQGYFLNDDVEAEIPEQEYNAILDITSFIEKNVRVHFNEADRRLLAIKLSGMKDVMDYDINSNSLVINENVYQLTLDILKDLSEDIGIPFEDDFDLQLNLMKHLTTMLIRLEYHIQISNPLKEMIKEKYAFGFKIASKAAYIISSRTNFQISEDEASYLALIFSLALEREKYKIEKKNILLIYGSNKGVASVLMHQYKNEFRDYIKEISLCSVKEAESLKLKNVDYVFAIAPFSSHFSVPMIDVSEFINRKDILAVKKVFSGDVEHILSDYYKEDQFFAGLKVESKEEVLRFLCQKAQSKYHLSNDYYESVMDRERAAKTVFGNSVAIPHALNTKFSETFVYVAVLDKAIIWSERSVQLVILTNAGKNRGRELVRFYDLTTDFISSRQLVQELIDNPKFNKLIEILESLVKKEG